MRSFEVSLWDPRAVQALGVFDAVNHFEQFQTCKTRVCRFMNSLSYKYVLQMEHGINQCPVWNHAHTRVYAQRMHSDHLHEHVWTNMSYVLEYGVCSMKGSWYIRDVASTLCQASWLSWPITDPGRLYVRFGRLAWDFVWRCSIVSQSWSEWFKFVPKMDLQPTCSKFRILATRYYQIVYSPILRAPFAPCMPSETLRHSPGH
jgi:hypothetical protein